MKSLLKMPRQGGKIRSLRHTQDLLVSAELVKLLESQDRQNTEFWNRYFSDCQSQKSTRTSVEHSDAKNVKGSWIFSASDEYLAMLDKAGVIPMFRTYRVNDYGRRWAD